MAKEKKPKKEKPKPIDGFGPHERAKIHAAVRQVWHRSTARRLTIKRCTDKEGYVFCEKCKKRVPKIFIDHVVPVGEVGGSHYIQKMFVSSEGLQGWCHDCHSPKTKAERKSKAASLNPKKEKKSRKRKNEALETVVPLSDRQLPLLAEEADDLPL